VDELKNLLKWSYALKQSIPWDPGVPTMYMFDEAVRAAYQRVVAGIWEEQSQVCREALKKIRQAEHG
jgi:hypothetical protein